jgi:hypothetical protein
MKLSSVALILALESANAFLPQHSCRSHTTFALKGYLDDLTTSLNAPDGNPNPEEESAEANKMSKEDIDRFGPGTWEGFVDFNEFDG